MRRAYLAALLGLGAVLAGCTVGPNYRPPPVLRDTSDTPSLIGVKDGTYEELAPLPASWWRLYNDNLLDDLVHKALIHNTDLRGALANLQESQAALRGAQSQLLPQTSLTSMVSHGDSSLRTQALSLTTAPITLWDISEMVSYDLDLFGKLRRTIESASDSLEASQAALDLARINVAASTAEAYSAACGAGLQIGITVRSISVAQQTLDVTQRRYEAGLAADEDVARARAQLSQTRASLPSYTSAQRTALYMLATLTGDQPESFPAAVSNCSSPPVLTQPIPVGDGAGLLARRPDVRQAERKLASSVASIGVSTAALYPSITIGGSASELKTRVGTVDARLFSWNVGSLLSWSFPNVTAARALIASSNAMAKSSLADFDGKVLKALRETETALTKLTQQLAAQRDYESARTESAKAYEETLKKYQVGVGKFLDVLLAEQSFIQAESSLASSESSVSQDQLSLFMALGGGWQNAPPVVDVSLTAVTDRLHE